MGNCFSSGNRDDDLVLLDKEKKSKRARVQTDESNDYKNEINDSDEVEKQGNNKNNVVHSHPQMPHIKAQSEFKLPIGKKINDISDPAVPTLNRPISIPAHLGDLSSLERSDPEETKRAKLELYNPVMSEITPWLFLGSDVVARDDKKLSSAGVTHILNSAAHVCRDYHKDTGKYVYKSFYLADGPQEDLECVIYDVIDFLEEGTGKGGNDNSPRPPKAFVHCWQGVSRSSSCCIAYLMYKNGWNYETSYNYVREKRPIATPNAGFMCQILAWHKRTVEGVLKPRLYSIRSQSPDAPDYFVAKHITQTLSSSLRSTTCFLLHCPNVLFLWKGKNSQSAQVDVAMKQANRLQKYEHAKKLVVIEEGNETNEFWNNFEDGKKGFDEKKASGELNEEITYATPIRSRVMVPEQEEETKQPKPKSKPIMFSHPDWEEMGLFDSEDLDDDGVFVVFSNTGNPEEDFAYVWVGEGVEDVGESEAIQLAKDCFQQSQHSCQNITYVTQGNEDEKFWSLFVNG